MADVIEITMGDLTKGTVVNGEWQGTGVFDTLISAVNKNIELQYSKGRITGQDYANVYLGALQAVLGQSVDLLLRKDLTEAQIDDARKGIELKESQIEGIGYDNQVKVEQVRMSQFEREFIQPAQLDKLEKEIDVTERQVAIQESKLADELVTSQVQRNVMQEQIESANKEQLIRDVELKLAEQKVVGKKQSTVIGE
jgi:hypothetical protein